MLDFYFILDSQPRRAQGLGYAGGIEYEEFIKAQDLLLIEKHLDYYGNFRWGSQSVQQKRAMLTPAITSAIPNLATILKQAFAAGYGLAASGD